MDTKPSPDPDPDANPAVPLAHSETGTGPPLVILHGLFGNKRNWQALSRRLATDYRVICADLRNHGDSPWASAMDYPAMAVDVADLIEAKGAAPALLMGHSMGGKVAMTLALTRPELVAALIVVDILPAPTGSGLGAYVEAMLRIAPQNLTRRGDAATLLADTVADAGIRDFLLQNLQPGKAGYEWRINLAAIHAGMKLIEGFPTLPDGCNFPGPTLFLAGAQSDYIRPQHHALIRKLFPDSALETVAGAGHWVHAQAPEALLAALHRFAERWR